MMIILKFQKIEIGLNDVYVINNNFECAYAIIRIIKD